MLIWRRSRSLLGDREASTKGFFTASPIAATYQSIPWDSGHNEGEAPPEIEEGDHDSSPSEESHTSRNNHVLNGTLL